LRINHAGGVKPSGKFNDLKGIKVLIATPTRDRTCGTDFATSRQATIDLFSKYGITGYTLPYENSCYVDFARNKFVSEFMKTDCTHLLQADSDMSWEPEDIIKMLTYDKEFIAGIGRKKTDEMEFAGVNYTDSMGTIEGQTGEKEEDVLIRMKYIGSALTLHKRSVFEKLAFNFPTLRTKATDGHYFYHSEYTADDWKTEDYVFCSLCEKVGIEIWCYPNIDMGHYGMKNYAGNWFKHLKSLPKAPDYTIERILCQLA